MMFASAVRREQVPSSRPVSREQRMQRLAQGAGASGAAAPGDPHAKLKRAGRAIDEWSASRSEKTLWQSWTSISPRTRIAFGLCAAAFSVAGLYVSDWLEQEYPAGTPRKDGPKLFSISVVDRAPTAQQS
ncbi:hypothetical protein MCUN1_002395 [Malassezia cuniculi]|uniref:Uncharacterized protein n=1 Tax=Malassezia cuniculi TaxID=948313 RepID=A0AAF0EVX3_9BASI|nr:hypothetical protein MCUN1_002395 [Malassezia cuniculi]